MSDEQARDPEQETGEPGSGGEPESTFLSHLVELRQRLVRVVICVGIAFGLLYAISDHLYSWIAAPLLAELAPGTSMIAIEVASPFFIPLKLAFMAAVVVSVPYILYQLWAFVAPGLYLHERRLVQPLVISSTILFYTGVAFAYFVVAPIAFRFFTGTGPEGVDMMTDIARYLDFVIMLFFAFGIAFEVPVATILLVMTGVTTPEALASKRPYIFVGAFVVGMLLTPPDPISQLLIALPMWLMFEAGVVLSKIMRRRQRERAGIEDASDSDSDSDSDSES